METRRDPTSVRLPTSVRARFHPFHLSHPITTPAHPTSCPHEDPGAPARGPVTRCIADMVPIQPSALEHPSTRDHGS